jgi:hypothetical protein
MYWQSNFKVRVLICKSARKNANCYDVTKAVSVSRIICDLVLENMHLNFAWRDF